MSLLDNGPHSVVVYPAVKVTQANHSVMYVDGDPVTVSGLQVQPTDAAERIALGAQPGTTRTIRGRGPWPGGLHSQVEIVGDSEPGRRWDQIGEAEVHSAGRSGRTHHFQVVIQARSAKAR